MMNIKKKKFFSFQKISHKIVYNKENLMF